MGKSLCHTSPNNANQAINNVQVFSRKLAQPKAAAQTMLHKLPNTQIVQTKLPNTQISQTKRTIQLDSPFISSIWLSYYLVDVISSF